LTASRLALMLMEPVTPAKPFVAAMASRSLTLSVPPARLMASARTFIAS
jgi:hypothetical protein